MREYLSTTLDRCSFAEITISLDYMSDLSKRARNLEDG